MVFKFNTESYDSKYGDSAGYANAYTKAFYDMQGNGSDSRGNRQILADRFNAAGDTFSNLFTNLVGRAPTQGELDKFFNENAYSTVHNANGGSGLSERDTQGVSNNIQQYVGDTFQPQAKDYATQQLQQQQGQANDLANQYRQMGQQSLNSTASYLQDYQQQLFNRLQPQILTSLQAQGLLNTGGLNEAMAGAQKDLASQARGYLADANMQMQNQANQIAFGGASAPYYYQQGNYMNQVPYMQQQANGALNYNNSYALNQQQYFNQLGLQNNQARLMQDMQPSFMRTLGQSFGNSLGSNLGNWAAPPKFNFMGFGAGPANSDQGAPTGKSPSGN